MPAEDLGAGGWEVEAVGPRSARINFYSSRTQNDRHALLSWLNHTQARGAHEGGCHTLHIPCTDRAAQTRGSPCSEDAPQCAQCRRCCEPSPRFGLCRRVRHRCCFAHAPAHASAPPPAAPQLQWTPVAPMPSPRASWTGCQQCTTRVRTPSCCGRARRTRAS